MKRSQIKNHHKRRNQGIAVLSSGIIALCILMLMPIHMGLSAGIAAMSLIIFPFAIILSLLLLRFSHGRTKLVTFAAIATSTLGLLTPQIFYISVANRFETPIHFDPRSYVLFSGETNRRPDSIHTYKTVGETSLKVAYYASTGTEKNPLIVLLHGGGWQYGNYLQTGNWPQTLTQAGFSVASVQYRLSAPNTTTWREAPQDIQDALSFLRANAAMFDIDETDINLLGQSAGGHLALLEAYKNHSVRSVISLYAPVDLELDYHTSRDKSAELLFIGGAPHEYPDRYRELSPLTYVSEMTPSTLIIQGTRDDLVDDQNALLLSSTLAKHTVDHQLLLLPLTGHSFENQHGGFATQISERAIIDFLRR